MKRTEKERTINVALSIGMLDKNDFFVERETIRYEGKNLNEIIDAAITELKEELKLEFVE